MASESTRLHWSPFHNVNQSILSDSKIANRKLKFETIPYRQISKICIRRFADGRVAVFATRIYYLECRPSKGQGQTRVRRALESYARRLMGHDRGSRGCCIPTVWGLFNCGAGGIFQILKFVIVSSFWMFEMLLKMR